MLLGYIRGGARGNACVAPAWTCAESPHLWPVLPTGTDLNTASTNAPMGKCTIPLSVMLAVRASRVCILVRQGWGLESRACD